MSVMIVPAQYRGSAERLLASAKIRAVWSPAPSADAIRTRDEENLVREIVALTEAPAEEDLAAAKVLLAERSAEEIAAVLVRIRREALPAPEVLETPPAFNRQARPQHKKGPWPAKRKFGASAWVDDRKRGPEKKGPEKPWHKKKKYGKGGAKNASAGAHKQKFAR